NMSEPLRTVFLQFLSFVRHTQKIDTPCENRDFNYIVTEYGEEYEEGCMADDEDSWRRLSDMRKRYDTGDIGTIMQEISCSKVVEADLVAELNKLLAEDINHADEGLIAIMLAGIKLLRQDCIFNYDYNPGSTDYNDYDTEVIDFDRGLCFCWGTDVNDPVVQMAIEFYNNDEQALETYGPASYLVLAPNTDCLLVKSDFPARFAKWYDTFYEELEKYISDGTSNE
ncbi:MAG: hypothetical protein RR249_06985, partial [Tannerellaceae bacterium]